MSQPRKISKKSAAEKVACLEKAGKTEKAMVAQKAAPQSKDASSQKTVVSEKAMAAVTATLESTKSRDKLAVVNLLFKQLRTMAKRETEKVNSANTSKRLAQRRHRLQFHVFMKQLLHTTYLTELLTSPRYTVRDVQDLDLAKQWCAEEHVGESLSMLTTFYKLNNPEKGHTEASLDALLHKYRDWEMVLFQRLYRKYSCPEYPVCVDTKQFKELCPDIMLI